VRHETDIDLTQGELEQLQRFARERGISLEEAAAQLAQKSITKYFVIPKKTGNVALMRGLNRANDRPSGESK